MKLFDSVFLHFPCDGTRGAGKGGGVFLILEPVTLAALPAPLPLTFQQRTAKQKQKPMKSPRSRFIRERKRDRPGTTYQRRTNNQPLTSTIHPL